MFADCYNNNSDLCIVAHLKALSIKISAFAIFTQNSLALKSAGIVLVLLLRQAKHPKECCLMQSSYQH